jgi:hypothetical protein
MQLIRGTSLQPSSLPARKGAWRLRPGEVPSWIDLPLDRKVMGACRSRAREAGLGVDAWLALLVECELVRSHLAGFGFDAGKVVDEASRSLGIARLAPSASLRQWGAQLNGQDREGDLPLDELPSVALPERLLVQLAPGTIPEFLTAAVGREAESEALPLERIAAAVGLTMEAWAYLTTLRLQGTGGV